MITRVNSKGTDWLVMRSHLNTLISALHREMEGQLTVEEYNRAAGGIALARSVIEWVEPSSPPQTIEDDYGISDPSQGDYA